MDLGIAGKRAAVSAATTGLGFAAAAALAAEGARVAICGRDQARVGEAAARLHPGAVGIAADLTDPDECERFVADAAEALGGLDILVVNGPGPRPGRFVDVAPGDYPAAIDASLMSVVRMCYAAVPGMRAQRWGRIIAITSSSVRQPIENLILSTTARAGATGFLKSLAREIAADGVTVNSVQPGLHATARLAAVYGEGIGAELEAIPAHAAGRPQDLGAVVAFLCSDQARYLTGVAIPVDGGRYAALL